MKFMYPGIALIAVLLTFGAVIAEESLPAIETVNTGSPVRFEHVEIEKVGGQYVLSGIIKRSVYNSSVSPGHIDYVVLNSEGKLLAEGATTYSPSLSLRRWRHGSSFSVILPKSVGSNSTVKVAFHKNQGSNETHSSPYVHQSNIIIEKKL